jgi:hypothetical protein
MSKPLTIAIGALAAWLTSLTPVPAQADSVESTSCVGTFWSQSCVTRWRDNVGNPHFIEVSPLRSEQDIAESKERDRLWQARCKPLVERDRYGVGRYTYAQPGCEFGG